MKRRRRKLPFPMGKDCPQYRRVWIIVDAAVAEAMKAHPEYIPDDISPRVMRESIVKRVTGAITGWATQVEQARSGERPAGETASCSAKVDASGSWTGSRAHDGGYVVSHGAGLVTEPAP